MMNNNIDKTKLVEYLSAHGDSSFQHLLSLIHEGEFDNTDFQALSQQFVGKRLKDFFCNGFFGSREYDLENALILKIYEASDYPAIIIEVLKSNDRISYGEFDGSWNDWQTVYEHLVEWTTKHEED